MTRRKSHSVCLSRMKIEKVFFYYENFPVDLLTDTRPDWEINNYEKQNGEKLADQLLRDGQKEPIIINVNRFDAKVRVPSYIYVQPGGCRIHAMRGLKWKHCKAMILTYDFMLPYLKKIGFLHHNLIPVTRNNLGDYFSNLESPSYQWAKRFLNS